MLERDGSTLASVTAASAILSTLLAVPAVTPILHAAAVMPFFYTAQRRPDPAWSATIVLRWMIALFISLMVIGVFVPDRVGASVPFGVAIGVAVRAWVAGGGSAPLTLGQLLWGGLAFLVLSVASGGAVGFLIASLALSTTACVAIQLFRHGDNLLQMAIAAVPLWQWCALAAIPFLIVPTSALFYQRVVGVEREPEDITIARLHMYFGAALLAGAILFRLTLAGPWRTLLSHWTVF